MLCIACEIKLKPNDNVQSKIEVVRYDRLQSRYLTTGDFSALQEMNTELVFIFKKMERTFSSPNPR